MGAGKPDPARAMSDCLADLYVRLEDFTEEGSTQSLLKVLSLLRDLRVTMRTFEQFAIEALRRDDAPWPEITAGFEVTREDALWRFPFPAGSPEEIENAKLNFANLQAASDSQNDSGLTKGNIYTRNDLRELHMIRDATLNNGVFHFKERHEVWLFVTENKQADREQYVDKLVGDTLYWQGQRMGRTDSLIINHIRTGERLMLFYRRAKYEFEGAAFRYEGIFEYVSHSVSNPTSFTLQLVPP